MGGVERDSTPVFAPGAAARGRRPRCAVQQIGQSVVCCSSSGSEQAHKRGQDQGRHLGQHALERQRGSSPGGEPPGTSSRGLADRPRLSHAPVSELDAFARRSRLASPTMSVPCLASRSACDLRPNLAIGHDERKGGGFRTLAGCAARSISRLVRITPPAGLPCPTPHTPRTGSGSCGRLPCAISGVRGKVRIRTAGVPSPHPTPLAGPGRAPRPSASSGRPPRPYGAGISSGSRAIALAMARASACVRPWGPA
jgi:hypothetical protein